MDPRKPDVGAGKMVELCLLTDPKNTQGQKAHEIHHQPRSKRGQAAP